MKIVDYIKPFEEKFNCTLVQYTGSTEKIIFKNNLLNKEFSIVYTTLIDRVNNNYETDFVATIYNKLAVLCQKNGLELLSDYKTARNKLVFLHKESGVIHTQTWDTIQFNNSITLRYNSDYYRYKLIKKLETINMSLLTEGKLKDSNKINFICNSCKFSYFETCNKVITRRTHCTNCNSKNLNNKLINQKKVLKTPYTNYWLYFVKFNTVNHSQVFKIGITIKSNPKTRFNYSSYKNTDMMFTVKLPLYKAFYVEQKIIQLYKEYRYKDNLKFDGYTESFNSTIDYQEVIKNIMTLLEEIQDRKPRELLENLVVDNQQPSLRNAT